MMCSSVVRNAFFSVLLPFAIVVAFFRRFILWLFFIHTSHTLSGCTLDRTNMVLIYIIFVSRHSCLSRSHSIETVCVRSRFFNHHNINNSNHNMQKKSNNIGFGECVKFVAYACENWGFSRILWAVFVLSSSTSISMCWRFLLFFFFSTVLYYWHTLCVSTDCYHHI